MAIRNAKLGGTDFVEEGLKPSEFNATNDAIIDEHRTIATNVAESAYKTLKAAGSFENGEDIMADRFTSAAGVNACVNSTTSYTAIDISSETLDDPNTFTNASNFGTTSETSKTGVTSGTLGRTFSAARYIERAFFSFRLTGNGAGYTVKLVFQYYDGSNWNDVGMIGYWYGSGNTGTITSYFDLHKEVQGVRVVYTSSHTTNTVNLYQSVFYEKTSFDTTALFSTNKYILGNNLTTPTYYAGPNMVSGASSGNLSCTGTILKRGIFSFIGAHCNGSGNITVKKNGNVIYTGASNISGSVYKTTTYEFSLWTDMFEIGDTFLIETTGAIYYASGQTYSGTAFSYTSTNVPSFLNSAPAAPWIGFIEIPRDSSSSIIMDSNTLLLNGSETTIACYGNTLNTLYNSGTGDGNNDTQSFTKTGTDSTNDIIGGIKIFAKNNVLLKKVRVPYYNAATNASTLSIFNSNKTLLKSYSTNSLTTGTADGADDSNSISSTWSTNAAQTFLGGMGIKVNNNCYLKSVTREASCTGTTAYLVRNNIVIASQTFSGNTATFGTVTGQFLEAGEVYGILIGSNGSAYTNRQGSTTTFTPSADVSLYAGTADTNGSTATYSSATKTTSFAISGNHYNIASFVTQTASTESTRYIDTIDFTLEAGKSYYVMENMSSYLSANQWITSYSKTFPETGTDINLIGGAYTPLITTTISDSTSVFKSCFELVTQNISGALTSVTSLKFNISDGTTTTSDVTANSQGKAIVNVSALSGGVMKVTAKLETTDTSLTPELYGVGVNILR